MCKSTTNALNALHNPAPLVRYFSSRSTKCVEPSGVLEDLALFISDLITALYTYYALSVWDQ